jgi:hypothetical protein
MIFINGRSQTLIPTERLHQLCRCIEGFILPDIARTTRQFRSRTELFVGPKHHALMGQLYEIRSQVEHLRDVWLADDDERQDERGRRMRVLRECCFLEELSRNCIARFLGARGAWPYFANESTLARFWEANNAELRRRIWGAPFCMTELRARFDEARVSDTELGL